MFIDEVKFQQNNGNFNLSFIGSKIVYSGNFMNMYNFVQFNINFMFMLFVGMSLFGGGNVGKVQYILLNEN